ncbi:MAG TPA: helix-turn-helix transcriptional regulator [Bryobacterales bacterium]|nr:helix-turn-helix transcriptional regulator [Bryobacterales bacterium]
MIPRDEESYESRETLRRDLLADEAFRYGYAESFLNSYVAAQIKTLREQREMKQSDLAELMGTQQAGISRLENVNYSAWKTETLRRLARALGVRLRISFETFGSLLDEVDNFNRDALRRAKPNKDPQLLHPGRLSVQSESTVEADDIRGLYPAYAVGAGSIQLAATEEVPVYRTQDDHDHEKARNLIRFPESTTNDAQVAQGVHDAD